MLTSRFVRRTIEVGAIVVYAALFLWQAALGAFIGTEAAGLVFMVYAVAGLAPVLVMGAPWCWILIWVLPPGRTDLTVLDSRTFAYHALVLISFAINVALIRKLARGGSPGPAPSS